MSYFNILFLDENNGHDSRHNVVRWSRGYSNNILR